MINGEADLEAVEKYIKAAIEDKQWEIKSMEGQIEGLQEALSKVNAIQRTNMVGSGKARLNN